MRYSLELNKNTGTHKRITSLILLLTLLISCFSLTGCGSSTQKSALSPSNPVTITMWHNYGGSMQQTMDELIDEFNSTIGLEKGIILNVTAISSSADLNAALEMILNDDPGAPEMPDICTAYPKIAVKFKEKNTLCDLKKYFNQDELSAYIDSFIEEGIIDNGLYVFPIAKSTDVLYVNKTLFDQFSSETGISDDCFKTVEGICNASIEYYNWTDAFTPDIKDDGQSFFAADSWLNISQTAMYQLGSTLFSNDTLLLNSDNYKQFFNTVFPPILKGGFAIYDGYSSDLAKTGDIVCSTGSSAGALFYGDSITKDDGTVIPVEYNIYPYPVFENGKKMVIQRGNGMMVKKSDSAHEEAASEFLKWFTSADHNMQFVAETGYLPVTNKAFTDNLPTSLESIEDIRIKRMLTAVVDMYNNYTFYTVPTFNSYDEISKSYETNFKEITQKKHLEWITTDLSGDVDELSSATLLELQQK